MDHGEGNGEGPVVELAIENVLVVDDDSEAEEDPDGDVGVGEDDLLEDAVGEVGAFAHFGEVRLVVLIWNESEIM